MASDETSSNRRVTRSMAANAKRNTAATAKGGYEEEKAPAPAKKKMMRLPQEDLDRILSRPQVLELPPYVKNLMSQNPGLIPSAEEAMDEEMVEFYEDARMIRDSAEDYREFQAWVRSEYHKHGDVEVEDDFLAKVAEARAWRDEFRAELVQDMDDELKRIFFRDDDHL